MPGKSSKPSRLLVNPLIFVSSLALILTGMFATSTSAVNAAPTSAPAQSQPDYTGRVIGGFNAPRANTKFFLQFALKSPVGGSSLCGATALNRRWAITAAHCVHSSAGRIFIGPGKSALLVNPPVRSAGTPYYIKRVVVHPGWRPNSALVLNDLALVQTIKPMPVAPIAINPYPNLPAIGTAKRVYGFGQRNAYSSGSVAKYLQQGNVQDLAGPYGSCGDYGSSYRKVQQLCAGVPGGGIDACYGDSGGPLVATVAGRLRLVGIVSNGIDCAQPEYPGLYTRVSTYASWIQSWVAGSVWVTSNCANFKCTRNKGAKVRIRLRNNESTRSAFSVVGGGGNVRILPRSGLIAPNRARNVGVKITTGRKLCVPVIVRATGTPARKITIGTNGRVC